MTVTLRGFGTDVDNYASTCTVSLPAGVSEGDILICIIGTSLSRTASCGGWTALATSEYGHVLYKIATNSEPGSYTFSVGTSAYTTSCMGAYYGSVGALSVADYGSASGYTAPSVDADTANDKLLCFIGGDNGASFNPPAGMTQILFSSWTQSHIWGGSEQLSSSGATGTREMTLTSGGGNSNAISVVLTEESAPPEPESIEYGPTIWMT